MNEAHYSINVFLFALIKVELALAMIEKVPKDDERWHESEESLKNGFSGELGLEIDLAVKKAWSET